MRRLSALIFALAVALVLGACGGPTGREVAVTAAEQGCTPPTLTAAPGEALVLVVANQAKGDREVEGVDGTKLEEVVVPAGKTRKVAFTMPASGGARVKCYAPGGATTIIEIAAK